MMIPFWGQFCSAYSTSWTRLSLNPVQMLLKVGNSWPVENLAVMRSPLTLKHQSDGEARMIYCPQRRQVHSVRVKICRSSEWLATDQDSYLKGCLCQVPAIRKSSRRKSRKPFQWSVTSLNSSYKRCNLAFAFDPSPSAWHKHTIY